jgi:formylglycine-generating enzyme required for sulfatase activity
MVVIPPGKFTMGFEGGEEGRYEGPVRNINIKYAFALAQFEVTQAQYATFVESTGHVSGTGCAIWDGKDWHHTPGKDWRDPGYGRPPAPDEPVVCVTWRDVKAYVNWFAKRTGQPYRLPSEAEWEYAARAGTTGTYTWGDDPNGGCGVANHYDQSGESPNRPFPPVQCDDGFSGVAPVGSLAPNNFGLYDMTGNVWEWVEDCYRMPHPAGAPVDGSPFQVAGECDRRTVKGGAWFSSIFWQRPTFRGRDPEDRISYLFGFRLARDLAAD